METQRKKIDFPCWCSDAELFTFLEEMLCEYYLHCSLLLCLWGK